MTAPLSPGWTSCRTFAADFVRKPGVQRLLPGSVRCGGTAGRPTTKAENPVRHKYFCLFHLRPKVPGTCVVIGTCIVGLLLATVQYFRTASDWQKSTQVAVSSSVMLYRLNAMTGDNEGVRQRLIIEHVPRRDREHNQSTYLKSAFWAKCRHCFNTVCRRMKSSDLRKDMGTAMALSRNAVESLARSSRICAGWQVRAAYNRPQLTRSRKRPLTRSVRHGFPVYQCIRRTHFSAVECSRHFQCIAESFPPSDDARSQPGTPRFLQSSGCPYH